MKFKRHHNYTSLSDLELVSLLQKGDHAAYTEIMRRYYPVLINFAYRKIFDLPTAKDLVHDTLLHLWEKREVLSDKYGLQLHLFTVLRGRLLDFFKRQKVSRKYIDTVFRFQDIAEDTADYLVRRKDLLCWVDLEVQALPEKMRSVYLLSRKKELSRKEIALQLHMPENTVKTNMQRALKILNVRLNHLFFSFS